MAKISRLDWLAKFGFAARGVLYILLGWIALNTRSRTDEGQGAVFDTLHDMPAGSLILGATLVGLVAYGIYRLACGVFDIDHKGSEPKGLGGRALQVGSGFTHLFLAFTGWKYLQGAKPANNAGDRTSEQAAQTVLSMPMGSWVLILVGIVFFGAAAEQLRKAWRKSHMKGCSAEAPPFVCTIGQIGLASRAVVFAIVGWSFLRAAWTEDHHAARGLGSALAALRGHDTAYVLAAAGMILFGVFSLLLARYRIVPPVDVVKAGRAKAAALAS
ncbi:DUF1206 domain-containing protein [Novosphingobium tardum]|uniref:DUF1206 domain-containing protein n=1 Tax=Novosphingobium tardum TaxID=1538021 RepID=A0ABV8RR90_9SPHN